MSSGDSPRIQVAQRLAEWSSIGGRLHRDADRNTDRLYTSDTSRLDYHREVITEYLRRATPQRDGRSAIITAGPPGAGKSTAVKHLVPDLEDFRIIDADEIKDELIDQALRAGLYTDLLAEELPDGHRLAPRELAALVHQESVKIADQIRRICMERNENLVIEGTLTWADHGRQIFQGLADAQYVDVRLYGLAVDAATAHEQALERWWRGRQAWIAGTDPFGGRYTPPEAINACYLDNGESVCTTNALQFINYAQSGAIPSVQVTILHRESAGPLTVADERFYRS